MDRDQIKHMVDRFLSWKLPENFSPDAGISFKAAFNEHTAHPMKHEPSGTNLLDATQAEAMVRYMIDGMPGTPASDEMTLAALQNSIGSITAEIRALGFPDANVSVDVSSPGRFHNGQCFSGCVNPGAREKYRHYFGATLDDVLSGLRSYPAEAREKLDDLNGTLGLPLVSDQAATGATEREAIDDLIEQLEEQA